jgi:putative membrane protein
MRVVVAGIAFGLAASAPAIAHDGAHAAAAGPSAWDVAIMCALAAAGVLYAVGSRRLAARGARVRRVERVAFWSGLAATFAAVAPPLDRAAAVSFSAHMAQHELLMLIGAPLLIAGRPVVPLLWAIPDRLRPGASAGLRCSFLAGTWRALTVPLLAWGLHGAAIWVWHLPALYERAVQSEAVHALQHATFVGTAALFWWGLVYGRYGRAAYGASALYVFVTSVHTGILGALFALSESPYYPLYAARAAQAGIDAVADQQLAGLYMWIPAGVILTLFGLALVIAWLSEAERRASAANRVALLVLVAAYAAACSGMPHEQAVRRLTGGDPYAGRDKIRQYGCDSCHTIPGVPTADATVGPPLTRVARRVYLAGHLENTPENMMRWIRNPHAFDQKTVMPEMGVTERDSRDIAAYLYTLR